MGQVRSVTSDACSTWFTMVRRVLATWSFSGRSSLSCGFLPLRPKISRRSDHASSEPSLGQASITTRRIRASSRPWPSSSIRARYRCATRPPMLCVTSTRFSNGSPSVRRYSLRLSATVSISGSTRSGLHALRPVE